MVLYEFVPYTTIEIFVNLECECGQSLYEWIRVPTPDMTTEEVGIVHTSEYGTIVCSECETEYVYTITSDGFLQFDVLSDNFPIDFEPRFDCEDKRFRDVPYNSFLQVTPYGRVRNKKTDEIIKPEADHKNGWYTVDNPGYRVDPQPGSRDRCVEKVHRLVALAWLQGMPDYGDIVHHKNNNGFDNRVDNLQWVNYQLHRQIHGFCEK